MALLFLDGFDLYADGGGDIEPRWVTSGAGSGHYLVDATGGRFGGGCVRLGTGNAGTITRSVPASQTVIVGFAGLLEGGGTPDERRLLHVADDAVTHVTITADVSTGTWRARRGAFNGTELASSGSGPGSLDTSWHAYELKVTIDDVNGEVEFRQDGVTLFAATGVDTRNGGTAAATRVLLQSPRQSASVHRLLRLDDVYILSGAGDAPNDFLGDQRVSTLRPTADTAQADFTPSSGTDRFAMVDDAPGPDGDGTYVAGDQVGDRDLYTVGALGPDPAAINGVGLVVIARKDDAGSRELATVFKSGAATEVGGGEPLLTDYTALEAFFGVDPDGGGAWAKAAVNALAVGFEVVA